MHVIYDNILQYRVFSMCASLGRDVCGGAWSPDLASEAAEPAGSVRGSEPGGPSFSAHSDSEVGSDVGADPESDGSDSEC